MGDEPVDAEQPDEFEPASVYLDAALAPRRGTTLAKALRSLATIVAGLAGDLEGGPSAIDLVVTRRDTGNEVLRVSAGTVAESDRLLLRVRHDLATKRVGDFLAEWRMTEVREQEEGR